MSLNAASLAQPDPAVHAAVAGEPKRQQHHSELIASESFTYPAAM